jgi:hypothetical protein
MSIELDKIPLIKQKRDDDTGKTKLLNSVHNLKVEDKRSVVEHKIPGMEGGVLQDLGREPVQISFEGVIHGEEAKELLKNIRSKFKSGEAVPFASDLSGVADVTDVVIADLEYNEISGSPNSYKYSVTLKEYKPPPEKDEPAPSQEDEAKEEVEEKADEAKSSVNYVTGKIVDGEGNPMPDVDIKITWPDGEYSVKTNQEGVYRKDNLEPNEYTVKVDSKGYEDKEQKVKIE